MVLIDILQEEAAKKLKSSENTKNIPVILMTGYTLSGQNISKDHIDDMIEKPFDPRILEKKIERFLKSTG